MGYYNPPLPNFFDDDYIQSEVSFRATRIEQRIPVSNLVDYEDNYGTLGTSVSILHDVATKAHFVGLYIQPTTNTESLLFETSRLKFLIRKGDGALDEIASLSVQGTQIGNNDSSIVFAPIFDSNDFNVLYGAGIHCYHGFRITYQKTVSGTQSNLRGGWIGCKYATKD